MDKQAKDVNINDENMPDKDSAEYYKILSFKQLKESSKLAEQLICLRTDLENHLFKKNKNENSCVLTNDRDSYMPQAPKLAFTDESQDLVVPQPKKEQPLPMTMGFSTYNNSNNVSMLSASKKHNKKVSEADIKLISPSQILPVGAKIDPPKTPYNFTYRPHKHECPRSQPQIKNRLLLSGPIKKKDFR